MDNAQKKELIKKVESEYGVFELFQKLGLSQVTKKGSKVYCICPFHKNADNPTGFCYTNGFGYCFTNCHRKFDLYDIVMKVNSYDFIEAVYYLSDLVGYDVDFKAPKREIDKDNIDFLQQIRKARSVNVNFNFKVFDESILNDFIADMHTKLRSEGFDNEIRDYFNIGYCQNGYLEERITIPVDNIDGSILTVSGRSVLSDDELEILNIKKYLIRFDTDKSKTLYNISRALPYIKEKREVIVVEGFKSVWRLHQWGIKNVVAVMGSTISKEQTILLLKLNAKVIVCGDKDEAGKKLNKEVVESIRRFNEVAYMDLSRLDVKYKSSISDITREQYQYIYDNKKEVA